MFAECMVPALDFFLKICYNKEKKEKKHMDKTIISREELLNKIDEAKERIRILGAVAFDLPFDRFKENWYKKIDSGELTVEIICESESELNYNALISEDRKVSGEARGHEIGEFLRIAQEPLQNLKLYLQNERKCRHLEPTDKEGQRFFLRTYYIAPKIPVINIDNDYYIGMALTRFHHLEKFEQVTPDNLWYEEYMKYFCAFFDHPSGAKKYSTEYTAKGNKLEVIEMYNEHRIPLGQLPRDSFLGTTKVKVVVWGLIFDRCGRLLIHRRGINAKDNRNMWDKSVGGHIDIEKDIDTVKGASRELLEELYETEQEGQGGHNEDHITNTNADYLVFLGEWRPKYRYDRIFNEMNYRREHNYYFRLNYDYSKVVRESPRRLPDGTEQRVRVFVDLYVCVADCEFNDRVNARLLKNSKYLLLYPYQIKDLYKYGSFLDDDGHEVQYADLFEEGGLLFDKKEINEKHEFIVTPDLSNIINSDLWETDISSFSETLKLFNEKTNS